MSAKQTKTTKVTVTRKRTPKSISTSKSHASGTTSTQERCAKCGRYM